MSQDIFANWRERAKSVADEPFNSNLAFQLVREIQDSIADSRVGYRAFQASQILEGIRRADKPSSRQLSDAKAALNSLSKALDQIKLQ